MTKSFLQYDGYLTPQEIMFILKTDGSSLWSQKLGTRPYPELVDSLIPYYKFLYCPHIIPLVFQLSGQQTQ
jgi:hypothetical protein